MRSANLRTSLSPERPHQPQRPRFVLDEVTHVLAADQRQVLAEFLAMEIEKARAMLDLLIGHFVEHFRGRRKLCTQAFGEAAIDAAVLLLVGDGEGEDFLLGEVGKAFHGRSSYILEQF
jgi:hypothetical protein